MKWTLISEVSNIRYSHREIESEFNKTIREIKQYIKSITSRRKDIFRKIYKIVKKNLTPRKKEKFLKMCNEYIEAKMSDGSGRGIKFIIQFVQGTRTNKLLPMWNYEYVWGNVWIGSDISSYKVNFSCKPYDRNSHYKTYQSMRHPTFNLETKEFDESPDNLFENILGMINLENGEEDRDTALKSVKQIDYPKFNFITLLKCLGGIEHIKKEAEKAFTNYEDFIKTFDDGGEFHDERPLRWHIDYNVSVNGRHAEKYQTDIDAETKEEAIREVKRDVYAQMENEDILSDEVDIDIIDAYQHRSW